VSTALGPVSGPATATLLARIRAVQGALRTVQVGRQLLLAGAAACAVLLIARLLAAELAGRGDGGMAAAWWWAVAASLAAAVATWWRTRAPAPDLTHTALWVEEQGAASRGQAPDFALTTAVELLEARAELPLSLANAAARALDTAPTTPGLAAARRRAWTAPAAFGVGGALLLLLGRERPAAADRSAVPGAAGPAAGPASAAPMPLGTWQVRVRPPAYAALAVQDYDDPATVSALAGSMVEVRGSGDAPTVQRAGVPFAGGDSIGRRGGPMAVVVSEGGWRTSIVANGGAQSLRIERGGRARLLIVEGRADSVPRVSLELPARDSVFREARGLLPLAATTHDDIGLARAHFELLVTSGEGERFTVRTVMLASQQWSGRAGVRDARLRTTLDLGALALQPGDVVHLRAVARDAHPSADREYGSSETRAFRVARIAEYDSVAVEPAPPPEVDTSLLSQRMLLLLTEKLDKAQRRLARPEVRRESQKLARDQARLRLAVGDVVFQRLSGESAAEHAHSAGDGHDHGVDLQGGKLSISTSSTRGMLEEGNDSPVIAINQPLLEAYNAMWDAGRALEQGDPHGAIPPMKRALEAIERSRAASRLYLRGKPPQVIVDLAKVRLTGKDTGQITQRSRRAPLSARDAERDARLVRATSLVAVAGSAARDSVALLRVEALADAPAFAAALGAVLDVFERGGDATAAVMQARRVLGNVSRTRATVWSGGVTP
jgi:hypothetical protein